MSDSDRREHTRIDFQHRGAALIEQRVAIEIVNLSAGGMGLKTNVPLEPGSICNLVLFRGNLSVQSSVASCIRIPRRRMRYQVGVRFTKVSAQLLEEVLEMEKHFKGREVRVTARTDEEEEGIAIFQFSPQLSADDWSETMDLLQGYLDDGARNFVFDFAEVAKMEEAFLSRLLSLDEEILFEEGRLVLANCSSSLLSSLTVSQLATSIPIFESLEKAVVSIKAGRVDLREEP
ncbi:MAG: PilZ domain-containing protein [bacterium]